jgi:hypothetical protein
MQDLDILQGCYPQLYADGEAAGIHAGAENAPRSDHGVY